MRIIAKGTLTYSLHEIVNEDAEAEGEGSKSEEPKKEESTDEKAKTS